MRRALTVLAACGLMAAAAAAQSVCAGGAPAAVADQGKSVTIGNTVTTDVTPDTAKPAMSAKPPPGGSACAETALGPFRIAAILSVERKVPKPKPGAPLARVPALTLPPATMDQKLRVDLYIARGAEAQDAPQFDCTRTIIKPGGGQDGPADIGCEARSVPAGSTDYRAANFSFGIWNQADDPQGLWTIRIGIRDQLSGKRTALTLSYVYGKAAE